MWVKPTIDSFCRTGRDERNTGFGRRWWKPSHEPNSDHGRDVAQALLLASKNTDSGLTKIKIKQATYDYIKANKIIKITIDGDSFNIASVGRRANFLNKNLGSTFGEVFYIFELEYTK